MSKLNFTEKVQLLGKSGFLSKYYVTSYIFNKFGHPALSGNIKVVQLKIAPNLNQSKDS